MTMTLPGVTIIPPPTGSRDSAGRFGPGNPGRIRGQKTVSRRLAEAVMVDDAEAIARIVTNAAKDGDLNAAKIVLERVCPVRRGACVEIPGMPSVRTVEGRGAALARVLEAVADGEVSPEEGASIAAIIETVRKHQETETIAADVERIKTELGILS